MKTDYIKENAPDLSWVYLEYTDDMGHKYGDSNQFYDAVQIADKQIGRIWKAIEYRKTYFNEKYLLQQITEEIKKQGKIMEDKVKENALHGLLPMRKN